MSHSEPSTAQRRAGTGHGVGYLFAHFAIRLTIGLLIVSSLIAVYGVAPEPQRVDAPWQYALAASIGFVLYGALTAWGVYHLRGAQYPVTDGLVLVVSMAVIVSLGYAYAYLAIEAQNPGSFTEPLTKASSVYFTVTVLTTVGFGDITATADFSRLAVVSQMIVGLTVISLSAKLLVETTKSTRGFKKRKQELQTHDRDTQQSPPVGGDGRLP